MNTFFKQPVMRKQRQVRFVQVQPMHRPMSKGYETLPLLGIPTDGY
jgi:hypothetical protein